ncbi:MAG: BlaI/MecI/CopY family transcriptional regulator [Acidobacteriota bacterium]
MRKSALQNLSRRERQVMDAIYARGEATAAVVQAALPDPPSYSAVRAILRILVEKELLEHHRDGQRYLYRPTVPRDQARQSALDRLVQTFFDGSASRAAAALLDMESTRLSDDELHDLRTLIDQAADRES